MNAILPTALLLSFVAAVAAQQPSPVVAPQTLAEAWQEALRQAQRHEAPVLAFVLPPAGERADTARATATRDAERALGSWSELRDGVWVELDGKVPPITSARELFLRRVQLLRTVTPPFLCICGGDPPGPEAQMIFALTVPVIASAASCGAEPGETVVLASPAGERIAGFRLDLLDRAAFVAEVGAHVLADERLAARRAAVPEPVRTNWQTVVSYRTATGDLIAVREAANERARAALPAVAPLLVTRLEDGQLIAEPELWTWEVQRVPLGAERVPHARLRMPSGLLCMPELKVVGS